jgi:3-hydroxyisobutyrate dehydrogenase-like beta-hydroxyacid dehydrogenase
VKRRPEQEKSQSNHPDPNIYSQATQDRAQNDSIETISNDLDLCNTADIIISIVPPRDALATAQRIAAVSQNAAFQHKTDINPLYYLDLNAISPDSARRIHSLFNDATSAILSIDGGIIGGPPHLTSEGTWYKPSIPTSGPHRLPYPSSPGTSEPSLAEVLNIKHIGPTIGTATGLKMCFAALTKGMTALALQSFTTAQNLGVLDELHKHLEMMAPAIGVRCRKGVVSMVPKAYRWVAEMDEVR